MTINDTKEGTVFINSITFFSMTLLYQTNFNSIPKAINPILRTTREIAAEIPKSVGIFSGLNGVPLISHFIS